MSHSPTAITVPFVIYGWKGEVNDSGAPSWELFIASVDIWEERFDQDRPASCLVDPNSKKGIAELGKHEGWLIEAGNMYGHKYCEREGVYPVVITKGKRTVYAMNTDEYNHVGCVNMAYFADDRDVLEEFVTDMRLAGEIESNVAIMQWA